MGVRVLIVEDQRDMARMVRLALQQRWPDMDVVDVPSAEEALLELWKGLPDLIILDLGLPGIPGHEFLRQFRKSYPTLPVIVVTGLPRGEAEARLQGLTVEALFYKPFSPKALIEAVGRLLKLGEDSIALTLREIYEQFDAQSVFVMDAEGTILVAYGHPPERAEWEPLRLSVATLLESGRNIGRALDAEGQNLHICRGAERTLLLRDLSRGYGLALWGATERLPHWLAAWEDLDAYASRLWEALAARLGEPQEEAEAVPVASAAPAETAEVSLPETEVDRQEAERFWEEVVRQAEVDVAEPDVLSYEEARRLGLLPDLPFTAFASSDDEP